MVLEKTLESPLDCKEIQPVHSEGDQPSVFFAQIMNLQNKNKLTEIEKSHVVAKGEEA